MYRKFPLSSKKGTQNFDALVSKCISRTVLTKDVVRKFSQRARSYMLRYKSLELEDTNKNIATKNETTNLITLVKIESMKNVLKSTVRLLISIKISSWDQFPRWDLNLKKKSSQMSGREGKEGEKVYIIHIFTYLIKMIWSCVHHRQAATAAPRRRHGNSKPHIRVLSTDAPHQRQRLLSDTHLTGEETCR